MKPESQTQCAHHAKYTDGEDLPDDAASEDAAKQSTLM